MTAWAFDLNLKTIRRGNSTPTAISPTNAATEEKPECLFIVGMYVALTADDGDLQTGELRVYIIG